MKVITFLLAVMFCFPAYAIGPYCKGELTNVYLDINGGVYIIGSWRNDYTQICNIETRWKEVSPEICKGWFSLAMSAKVSKQTISVRYPEEIASCGVMPNYSKALPPKYLMLPQG